MSKYKELYNKIDLTDRETVKNLLLYRAYFEQTGFTSDGSAFNKISINQNSYTELLNIYIDLDVVIEECNLSVKNTTLLRLVVSGYTINYIYTNFENYNKEATKKMFNRIAEKIVERQLERNKEAEDNDDIAPERRGEET